MRQDRCYLLDKSAACGNLIGDFNDSNWEQTVFSMRSNSMIETQRDEDSEDEARVFQVFHFISFWVWEPVENVVNVLELTSPQPTWRRLRPWA